MSNDSTATAEPVTQAPATTTTAPAQNAPAAAATTNPPAQTGGNEPKGETKPPVQASPVPEKYELKAPQGSYVNQESVSRIEAFAKSQGLSNAQAQAMIDHDHAAISNQHARWIEELKADKELGGANFEKTAEITRRMALRFGGDSFLKILDDSGLGNHPQLARVFAGVEKELATLDDKKVTSNIPPIKAAKSVGQSMYPGMYDANGNPKK